MKVTIPRLAAVAVLLAAIGFLSAWAGLVPIAASSGHWPVTAWFLHFTMRRSVATRTLGMEAPPLDRPEWVVRGAGHFDFGCAPCHGAPGQPPSEVARNMTPHPPYLPPRIGDWEPEELFWIVKHGVKFTGMPSWPTSHRDDEVWAMVAFLRSLPGLSAADYRRLARGEARANSPPAKEGALREEIERCERCHGREGPAALAFPVLTGQEEAYLLNTLRAYAEGERFSGTMQPIASDLTEEAMRGLADHYANGAGRRPRLDGSRPAAHENRGRRIAEAGVPSRGVPSCAPCHGPGAAPRNPHYPELTGQRADYLQLQLELFKEGRRGGTPYAAIMEVVARRMTDDQMQDVARYYGSIGSAAGSSASEKRRR